MREVVMLVRLEELETRRAGGQWENKEAVHLRSRINQQLLAKYDALRKRFGAKFLTPLDHGCCAECHMTIPSIKAKLLSQDFVECDTCGRLVYDPELIFDSYLT